MMRIQYLLLAWLTAVGCTTAPVRAIPDPLPEVLEWAQAARPDGEGAYLGLKVRENGQGGLESLSFDPGVRVVSVAPGSPAALAGFAVGDVLLAWDQVATDDPESLDALLQTAATDQDPSLRVRRGDSVFDVSVKLAAVPGTADPIEPAKLVWRVDPSRSRAGWLAGASGDIMVTSDPEGPFPSAGIEVGSVVTGIDGVAYRSERALIRALQARPPGTRVVVAFRPPGTDSQGEPEEKTVRLLGPGSRVIDASLPVIAGYTSSPDGVESSFYLIDLWLISLFKYRRDGEERHWSLLRFFNFATGVGKLSE